MKTGFDKWVVVISVTLLVLVAGLTVFLDEGNQFPEFKNNALTGAAIGDLDEKSIFDFLDLVYKEPHERIDGKDVIIKGSTDENALGLLIKTPEKLVDVDGVRDGSANIEKIAKKHKKINISLKKKNNMKPKDLLLEFQNDT